MKLSMITLMIGTDNRTPFYFDTFEDYIDFKWDKIVNNKEFSIGNTVYNTGSRNDSLTLREYKSMLPLYIMPTRKAVLDTLGNQIVDVESNKPLWETDFDDSYIYESYSDTRYITVDVSRKWYREDGYKLLLEDDPDTTN